MPHDYERRGVFTLNEVLPYVPEKGTQRAIRKYTGKSISISKKKLRVFATKGTKCVCCGIEGSFLALERHKKGARRWHFNLYAIDNDGVEVEMTLDHTHPKSKGGTNEMDNLQPMCEPCNLAKGDSLQNPRKKVCECPSNAPTNLTKLSAKWRPFVRKKQYWSGGSYAKMLTYTLTKSSEASLTTQDSLKRSGGT